MPGSSSWRSPSPASNCQARAARTPRWPTDRFVSIPCTSPAKIPTCTHRASLALEGARQLDLAANGSINLKLAETLDPDLTASGVTTFQVEAHGPLQNPDLQGRIDFQNGSLSLEDLPNGLSQLHGTLEFNQNRLEVQDLTAMSGGGLLSVGGYLAYQHGIYADLVGHRQGGSHTLPRRGQLAGRSPNSNCRARRTTYSSAATCSSRDFPRAPISIWPRSLPPPAPPCRPSRRLERRRTTFASTCTLSPRRS